MFNRPNVTLVDIRSAPLTSVSARGLRTADAFYELDALVFATGFDAISGALNQIDVRGVGGVPLAEKWSAGPRAYLGVAPAGFPNMFIVTGPGSPSVFSNMVLSIEQHVQWIRDCVLYAGAHGYATVQAKPSAEDAWMAHVTQPGILHAVPARGLLVRGREHPGSRGCSRPTSAAASAYWSRCDAVAAAGYEGFALDRRLAMEQFCPSAGAADPRRDGRRGRPADLGDDAGAGAGHGHREQRAHRARARRGVRAGRRDPGSGGRDTRAGASPLPARQAWWSTTTAAAGWSARSTAGTRQSARWRPPPAVTW